MLLAIEADRRPEIETSGQGNPEALLILGSQISGFESAEKMGKSKNILVTGGAGYIGSVVVDQLASAGNNVVVVDNFSIGHHEAIVNPKVKVVAANLFQRRKLTQIMRENDIDAVVHLAASAEAGESMRKPEKYFQNNTAGSLSLMKAMFEADVNVLVFSSTAAVYGKPKKIPITEAAPLKPINVYGASKLMVEEMLSWFNQIYGLRYAALRYFNACGATDKLGENHQPESHLIPLAVQAVMGARPKLYLYGTDYETPDGTCIRDYVHVTDLADAHLLALASLMQENSKGKLIYNLGSQSGFSNREIIETVGKVAGKPVPVEEVGRRPGDPPVLIASSEKIRKEQGWRPQFTNLEEIIKSAYDWHMSHPQGYSR